jgi:hypothetical protein
LLGVLSVLVKHISVLLVCSLIKHVALRLSVLVEDVVALIICALIEHVSLPLIIKGIVGLVALSLVEEVGSGVGLSKDAVALGWGIVGYMKKRYTSIAEDVILLLLLVGVEDIIIIGEGVVLLSAKEVVWLIEH